MADRTPSPTQSEASTSSTHSLRYQNILNNNNNNVEESHKLLKKKLSMESPSSPEQRFHHKRARKDYHVIPMKRRLLDSPPVQSPPDGKSLRRDDSQDEDCNEEMQSSKTSILFFSSSSSSGAGTSGGGGSGSSIISNPSMGNPPPNSVIRKSSSSVITAPPTKSGAASTSSKQVLQAQKGRSPKCAQCLNHGMMERVRGHKRYCPWRHCRCFKCNVTYERRRVMASQVAVRRAQAQDEARAKEYTPIPLVREEPRSVDFFSNNNASQGPEIKHSQLFAPYHGDRKIGLIGRRDSGGVIPPMALPPSLPSSHPELLPRISPSHNLHHSSITHHPHLNLLQPHTSLSRRGSRLLVEEEESTTPLPIVCSPPSSSMGDKRGPLSDTEADDNKSVEGRSSLSRSTTDRDSIRGRSPKSGCGGVGSFSGDRKPLSPNTIGLSHNVIIPSTSVESILPVKSFGGLSSRGDHPSPSSSLVRSGGWQPLLDPILAKMHLQHQSGNNGTNVTTLMALPSSGSGSSAITSQTSMAAVAAAAAAACGVDPTTAHLGALKMYPHFGLQGSEALAVIGERKESVKTLLDLYRLPTEMDFLVYRILKDSNDDFKLASSKIFEAQCELRSYEILREAARAGYPYYHAAAAATSAYYYHHPVTGMVSAGNPPSGVSHSSTTSPDLYNSINSSSNHRINIAANTEKAQVTPSLPALEDSPTT